MGGMTYDEFAAQYLGATAMEESDMPNLGAVEESDVTLTDVDWSVTPVKNQGSCGSCWAFGTLGAIEAVHKHSSGKEVILAEQQLIDCSGQGCNGGSQEHAMNYLAGRSIYTASSYPYQARDGSCKRGTASGVTISGYQSTGK